VSHALEGFRLRIMWPSISKVSVLGGEGVCFGGVAFWMGCVVVDVADWVRFATASATVGGDGGGWSSVVVLLVIFDEVVPFSVFGG